MHLDVAGAHTFVHTGGSPLDVGEGVILLLHGAGNDHSVWRYQTRRLAQLGLPAVAPDLPGHGRSLGDVRTSVSGWAEWVHELLDALGAPRAILIGHSMGSLISLHAASTHPNRITGIALLATSDQMGVHPVLQDAADEQQTLAIDLIVGWSHTGDGRFSGHPQAGMWHTAFDRRVLERNLPALGRDLRSVATYDSAPAASTVASSEVSALVVAGEADRMTPARAGGKMAQTLGVDLHVIPRAGHSLILDNPIELNQVLLPWVEAQVGRWPAPALSGT